MKKMKGVVAVEPSSYALYEDSRARFKHQSLMQDYQELQKVYHFWVFNILFWVFIRSGVLYCVLS